MSMNELVSFEQAQALIRTGAPLLFAGDESVLARLDRGNWIGGTIPYFMTSSGGVCDKTKVFVTELPASVTVAALRFYAAADLPSVNNDAPAKGLSFIIIPAMSEAHLSFAENAPNYDKHLMHPLVGWIAGVDVAELATAKPKVFLGTEGKASDHDAVVMHCALAEGIKARIEIVNIFSRDPDGDSIKFREAGFNVNTAIVNGKEQSFSQYLASKDINTQLPLVSDYYGAMINVSIQQVNQADGTVSLYSPVWPEREYRFAKTVDDYAGTFNRMFPSDVGEAIFSCNCILNYLYGKLEGKRIGGLFGPITFGEIAYQLVNQTLVYVSLVNVAKT